MNNKLKTLGFISTLTIMSTANSGVMGPTQSNYSILNPFISLEGSWTALNPDLFPVTVQVLRDSGDYWGGRLAGGAMYFTNSSKFKYTAETGWSYFGKARKANQLNSVDLLLSGADLLLGVMYQPNNYGFFVKAGTLFQNANYKIDSVSKNTITINGGTVLEYTVLRENYNASYIMPEVKVGAVYDWNNWGISLAYTHAFGTTEPFHNFNMSSPMDNVVITAVNGRLQGVEINSILLGGYYKFA